LTPNAKGKKKEDTKEKNARKQSGDRDEKGEPSDTATGPGGSVGSGDGDD